LFIGIGLLLGTALPQQARAEAPLLTPDSIQTVAAETTSGLHTFFQTMEYDWSKLEGGVPPLILSSIPEDLSETPNIKVKKRTFFMGLLPMVLIANQEIRKEREEVLRIIARHRARQLKAGDYRRIDEIMERYGLRGRPLTDHRIRSSLLRRVDTIPPSLVLAQAANESAWGTSRFAQQGNNLFGEWTFKPGSGIVPAGRPEGATYEVRRFSSLFESIRSYMNNLNRHNAYRHLRSIREKLRQAGKPVTGIALAKGLMQYSERGEEYIQEIQTMIRQNKLARTNKASLRLPRSETLATLSVSASGAGLFSSRNRIIGHRTVLW